MSTSTLDARSDAVLASLARDVSRGNSASGDGGAEVASSGPTDLQSKVHKLIVTIIAATMLAACSSGRTASPAPSPSPSATVSVSVEVQVLSAWRAEHLAYADALRNLDPRAPGLAETAIDPALRRAVAYIAVTKAQGIIVRGSQNLGNPQVASLTPDTAVVASCVHDGLILLNPKTNKPVPGLAGQVTWNFERTTLRHVEGVGWLVADNLVHQDAKESVCIAR